MFKWERRLVETIDKNLPVLTCFLIILFALYMRRTGYYYNSFDFKSHFYPALPGYLYPPFYTLFIRMLPALSITPAMQVRILVCLFDFIAASGAVQLLKEIQPSKDQTALLSCFTLLIASPLTIEYGLLWIRPDSICMSAFLWAFVLHKRQRPITAGILFGVGIALLTQYVVLLLPVLYYEQRKMQTQRLDCTSNTLGKHPSLNAFLFSSTAIITALFLNFVAVGILKLAPHEGLFMLINWLVIHPESGAAFSELLVWLKVIPVYFGYMTGILALTMAFWKPKYRVPAAVIHLLLLLYVGYILQNGW